MGFNLKTVSDGGFAPIPQDRYTFSIEKAELGESQTGNPLIKLQLKVKGGGFDGRYVFDSLVFVDNSLWKVKTYLDAVKSKLTESENVEMQEVADALLGKELSAWCEITAARSPGGPQSNKLSQWTPVTEVSGSGLF